VAVSSKKEIGLSKRYMIIKLFGKKVTVTVTRVYKKSVKKEKKVKVKKTKRYKMTYKAIKCDYCDFVSIRKQGLASHMRSKHIIK
jgi:hypothetical protein